MADNLGISKNKTLSRFSVGYEKSIEENINATLDVSN